MKGRFILLGALFAVVILVYADEAQAIPQDVVFYNDAVVGSDEEYRLVTVYNSPPETTTIEFYGHGDELITHDSSTVNVYDGGSFGVEDVHESQMYDSSTVNVYEGGGFSGGSIGRLWLYNWSTLNVNGGEINTFICPDNFSTVNVYDGFVFDIQYYGYSTVNMYGGYIDTFINNDSVTETATVNIYGYDFEYEPKGRWEYFPDPGVGWWVSKLTGYSFDDELITYWGLPDPYTNPNINLIPEPGTVLFLGLGGLVLLRKRKGSGIYSK